MLLAAHQMPSAAGFGARGDGSSDDSAALQAALEVAGRDGGVCFGADWRSPNLAPLGNYRLWVDRKGRLRMKAGTPISDEDGGVVEG